MALAPSVIRKMVSKGSVLAPTLFILWTSYLPYIRCRKFACVDDICCTIQAENFAKLESTLTADLPRATQYCWRPCQVKCVPSAEFLGKPLAEYLCEWRSTKPWPSHTASINSQLDNTMRLISGAYGSLGFLGWLYWRTSLLHAFVGKWPLTILLTLWRNIWSGHYMLIS